MNLQDTLFNWLQISIVAEARPEDGAARETKDFFELILREDHALSRFSYEENDDLYRVEYEQDGQTRMQRYDRELAEQLLTDINSNPKYNE
ncbi:hypothetical protein P9314_10510 [Paenibacillus validus]|uniref:Uncharacterized protein n=1 Tax=Paenibacillus validus TaxID=44253 RepID=A0A7X2ZCR5_9BACL|nr:MULTISPECIES: hypothetical protein [Paenibacillus]MED4601134.1 hypothetical protein [Paenibacillus validus]MED4608190.1 hypothetical protein [Paenibacillus validus]MUG72569.1 hypothetical protein [Paenibacillus validus]